MATVAERQRQVEAPTAPRTSSLDELGEERPFWQIVALLYGGIFLLAVVLTAVCFLSAWLAAGKPY
jgi:hypothetical protein